jgi:hypothetical protein
MKRIVIFVTIFSIQAVTLFSIDYRTPGKKDLTNVLKLGALASQVSTSHQEKKQIMDDRKKIVLDAISNIDLTKSDTTASSVIPPEE